MPIPLRGLRRLGRLRQLRVRPAAHGGGGSPGRLAQVTLQNFGGADLPAGTPLRLAHAFGAGEVPAGSTATLDIGGTAVPATFARRSTVSGDLRCVDILATLPAPIAAGSSATLNVNSLPSSSFNDALPAGKAATDIVADILANHATVGITLEGLINSSGGTEGSGTWTADSNTALGLSGTHGGYRCTATGPTAADFTAWMKLRDPGNGNAEHAGLWARWYITAFLDSTTGAVTKLGWRAWLNQGRRDVANDRYVFTAKLAVGATTLRSWGYASDNRVLSFAPAAVNTSTGAITVTGHGFLRGEMARFTTTGTLPSPLAAGTDYWVLPVDANTIKLVTLQNGFFNVAPPTLALTTQGTGTHAVAGKVRSLRFQWLCLAGPDGLWDWHAGASAVAAPTVHPVHDAAYYRRTRMAPPIDLSVNLAHATDPRPQVYSPGTNASLDIHYGDTGARADVGSVWNDFAARMLRYRGDRLGYARTARVSALCQGATPQHWVRDDATFRLPTVNATAYSGLGAALATSYYFSAGSKSADFLPPLGGLDDYTQPQVAHQTFVTYPVYVFEGGQDMLDILYSQANYAIVQKVPNTAFISSRNQTLGGRAYYKTWPDGSEPRADAWAFTLLADVVAAGADADAEKTYLKDVFADSVDWGKYLLDNAMDATVKAAGSWAIGEMEKGGYGSASSGNAELSSDFMQCYFAFALAHAYSRLGGANLLAVLNQMATYFNNKWVNAACKSFWTSYHVKYKVGPGSAYTTYSPLPDWGILDSGSSGLRFAADGTASNIDAANGVLRIPLQAGDRVYLTRTSDNTPNAAPAPPSELALYTWYYAVNVAGDGLSFQLSATPGGSPIATPSTTGQQVLFWSDVHNRASGCPTTVYRHNGSPSSPNGGYLTLNRAACGYLYLAGVLPLSAFQAADALFQLETGAGLGPASFAGQDSLQNSVVTSV